MSENRVSGGGLAKLIPMSRAGVKKAKDSGRLYLGKDGLYDLNHPVNKRFLEDQRQKRGGKSKKLVEGVEYEPLTRIQVKNLIDSVGESMEVYLSKDQVIECKALIRMKFKKKMGVSNGNSA